MKKIQLLINENKFQHPGFEILSLANARNIRIQLPYAP